MKITELFSYVFAYVRIIISIIGIGFLYLIDPILKQRELIDIFFDSSKVKKVYNKKKTQNFNMTSMNKTNHGTSSMIFQNSYSNLGLEYKQKNNENSNNALKDSYKNAHNSNNSQSFIKTFCYQFIPSYNKHQYQKNDSMKKIIYKYYDINKFTDMIYDIQIIKKSIYPNELITLIQFHKKCNIEDIEEMNYLYGINLTPHKQKLSELKEWINSSNFIDKIKNKEYFMSLISHLTSIKKTNSLQEISKILKIHE